MTESELYQPVRDWLQSRGYEVHVEIFGCDVVAVKDGQLTVVELKVAFTQKLVDQLNNRAGWADFVYAAVPGKRGPHNRRDFRGGYVKQRGFGVLLVDGCKVHKFMGAKPQPWLRNQMRAYRLKKLAGRPPAMEHELAGLPCGTQLREQRTKRTPAPNPTPTP